MNSKYSFMRYALVLFMLIFSGNFFGIAQEWQWADKLSGTLDNVSRGIVVDSDGNVYVYAQIKGTVNTGTDVFVTSGSTDALLVKFDADGNYQWGLQLGGADQETPTDITIDAANNIYVTGGFKGTAEFNPASPGGAGELINSNPDALNKNDIYLAKYSSAGTFVWAYQVSTGAHNEFSRAISVYGNDILMVGDFKTEITFNGTQTVIATGSSQDVFAAKIDQAGGTPSTDWYKHFPTAVDNGKLLSVHITASDDVYIGGYFEDKIYYDTDSCVSIGSTDIVLFKLDTDGNVLWVRQGGGTALDQINTVLCDQYENVYFTGYFSTTANFDVSSKGAYDSSPLVSKGSYDILLGKYNKTGDLQFVVGNGDTSTDNAYGLSLYQNYVVFSGYYSGTLIVNNDTLTSNLGNNDTGFLMYDIDGNPIEAHGMTGVLDDRGLSVIFDNSGSSFVTGYFQSDTLYVGSQILVNATDDLSPKRKDVFIAKYDPPFSATFTKIQNLSCYDDNSGELIVTPYFGTYPYTYEWTGSTSTDSTATGLAAGPYQVIVTDALLNKDTVNVILIEPSVISTVMNPTDAQCFGEGSGAIDLEVSGGTAPYTYLWSGEGISETTQDIANLFAGTYDVTVTDANSCTKDDSQIISEPDPFSYAASAVTDILRPPDANGAIDLEVAGGSPPYTYFWEGPDVVNLVPTAEDQSGLDVGGPYKVTVTDSRTCTGDTTFALGDNTDFIVIIDSTSDVSCFGGSDGYLRVIVVSGGVPPFSYVWKKGGDDQGFSAELTGASAGTYSVIVTDNTLDTATDEEPITEPSSALLVSLVTVQDEQCNGACDGSIDINVSGGTPPYSYNWTGPISSTDPDLYDLCLGFYSITVTDANGCTDQINNIEIEEAPVIAVNPSVTQPILCNGELTGEICANASGGTGTLTYLWNDPGAQTTACATGLGAGTYHVTVTDDNGCQKIYPNVVLTEPTPLVITEMHQDVTCFGGSDGTIAIIVSGGTPPYTYLWDDFAITQNRGALLPGQYCVTITDANNCQEYLCIDINEPVEIVINDVTTTDVI